MEGPNHPWQSESAGTPTGSTRFGVRVASGRDARSRGASVVRNFNPARDPPSIVNDDGVRSLQARRGGPSVPEDRHQPRRGEELLRRDRWLARIEAAGGAAEAPPHQPSDGSAGEVEVAGAMQHPDAQPSGALMQLVDRLGAIEAIIVPAEKGMSASADPLLRQGVHACPHRGGSSAPVALLPCARCPELRSRPWGRALAFGLGCSLRGRVRKHTRGRKHKPVGNTHRTHIDCSALSRVNGYADLSAAKGSVFEGAPTRQRDP